MNYEELLAARNTGKQSKTWLPIGYYYREQVEGKWRGIVDIHPSLHQNMVFTKALAKECKRNSLLANSHQIHFGTVEADGEVRQLELQTGHYITFEQLLRDNPAIIANQQFIDNTLEALVELTTYLHKQGVRHLCFSPKTVFVRKGDNSVMLLSHGSFYSELSDQRAFYGDESQYVAPEVLAGQGNDERSDVYGIGRFLQSLFVQGDLPLELRQAVKKATAESPDKRYATPADLLKAVQRRRSTMRSLLTLLVALVIAGACVFVYFELFPETQPVEFVKPAPRQPADDLLDDGATPEELELLGSDTLGVDSMLTDRDFQAKAEEIFRKNYEKEAERILLKIYNKGYMSNSEKKFMSESESTIEELMRVQSEMSRETGIPPERAQVIASQIIERITDQKKKELGGTNSRAVKLPERNRK